MVVVCVFVLTVVLVDVTTLTDVDVVVGPDTVAVEVDVVVGPDTVAVVVGPGIVVVGPDTVAVVVAVAVAVVVLTDADPVTVPMLTAVNGGTAKLANPVLGGCALSCELTTTEYAVAFTRAGSVPMVSGPDHVLVVVE